VREIVPRRVAILTLVRWRHELRAGEISKHFRSTRPGISQHLLVLTNAGLLCERRQGTSRFYSLRREDFGELRAFLDTFWDESLSRLKREVEHEARPRAWPLIRSARHSTSEHVWIV
jgi:DNA-binding transcriptional ArsR family regulator